MRMPTPGKEKRAGTPRKGDQPQNWRATDTRTSGQQPKNWTGHRYFLNLVGVFKLCEPLQLQRVGGRCTSLKGNAELGGFPPTMSWPRSVLAAYLQRV